jgi:hypothetical protein
VREDLLDLWEIPADARCITTNGTVKSNGRAVMGRGCAKQACEKYPFLQITLGKILKAHGNHVAVLIGANHDGTDGIPLVTFPVKHDWNMRADLTLIRQSAYELASLADRAGWKSVVLPRPGCGNGQRKWHEVRPILQPILDDRFTVVTL